MPLPDLLIATWMPGRVTAPLSGWTGWRRCLSGAGSFSLGLDGLFRHVVDDRRDAQREGRVG